jgi:hypothetical protein
MVKTALNGLLAVSISFFCSQVLAIADTNVRATLNGDAETPAIATVAGGTGEFNINDDDTEITYKLDLTNIEDTTAAHIHVGAFGTSGPIILTLSPESFGDSLSDTLDQSNFTPEPAQGINTFSDAINAIKGGNAYVNVHTEKNPNGEIRGQLVTVP